MKHEINMKKYFIIVLIILSIIYAIILLGLNLRTIDSDRFGLRYRSESILFPEELEKGDIYEYSHFYDYQLKDGIETIEVFKYTENSFYKEIERLEKLVCVETTKSIVKDSNKVLFNYLTYVTKYIPGESYEYACVDEANFRISYISLDEMSLKRIKISSDLLPKIYTSGDDKYYECCYDIYISANEAKYYNWNLA